jgi:hypothetical protein
MNISGMPGFAPTITADTPDIEVIGLDNGRIEVDSYDIETLTLVYYARAIGEFFGHLSL